MEMNLLSKEGLFALNPSIQEVWVVFGWDSYNGKCDGGIVGYLISEEEPVMPEAEAIYDEEEGWTESHSYSVKRLLDQMQ